MKLKLSVIMPAYNHEKYVSQAIESVLMQRTNFDFEILINDDASTDRTAEIIESYVKKYPGRITFFRQTANKGLLESYKTLMENAQGEYVAFLETDDYYIDDRKLQKQADFFDANSEYGLCAMSFCNVEEDGRDSIFFDDHIDERLNGDWYGELFNANFIYGVLTVCVRKSVFDRYCKIDDYIERNFQTFDYPVWLTLARFSKCKYIHSEGQVAGGYRILSTSISHSKDYKKQRDFFLNCNSIQDFIIEEFGSYGVDEFLMNELRFERLLYWAFDNKKLFDFVRFAKKLKGRRRRFALIHKFPVAFYVGSKFSKKWLERFYAP